MLNRYIYMYTRMYIYICIYTYMGVERIGAQSLRKQLGKLHIYIHISIYIYMLLYIIILLYNYVYMGGSRVNPRCSISRLASLWGESSLRPYDRFARRPVAPRVPLGPQPPLWGNGMPSVFTRV